MINKGCAVFPGFPIMNPQYALEPDTKYTVYEIYDRIVKGATDGQVSMDLLKQIGIAWGAPYPIHEGLISHPGPGGWLRPWFTHNLAVKKKIRYQLPYQEKLMKVGVEMKRRLNERNIYWWDKQCDAYRSLPGWSEHIYEVYGTDPQYDLWLTNSKNNQYSWSGHTEIAWSNQVAAQLKGHRGVLMHTETASKRGIKQGDKVWVESSYGKVTTKAEIIEGIRPDTLIMIGQHGHYLKPGSKDLEVPASNTLIPLSIEMTAEDGGVSDHVKVKVYKA
jgi:phenylacetyl-CoA:acceptor oxidoreductase